MKLKKKTVHSKNGRIEEEYFIDPIDGLKNGLSRTWHSNGQLWKQCTYKDNMLDGPYWEYNQRGEFESATFSNNKLIKSSTGASS